MTQHENAQQASRLRRKAEELEGVGRTREALQCRREAVALTPGDSRTREDLAQMYLQSALYDEAIGECKALLRLCPNSLFASDLLSVAYLQKGETEKALVVNDEMIRLSPNDPRNHFKRGVLCQQRGDLRAAMEALLIALEMAPSGSVEEREADEAIDALDRKQIRQIMILIAEDRLFRMRLVRDVAEAASEKGYFLSPAALGFIQQVALGTVQAQVYIGREGEYLPATSRFRLYN